MNDILHKDNIIASIIEGSDYEGHGYVACVKDGMAAIGNVSHCSCYGTWAYDNGEPDGCSEIWSGTVDELVVLAETDGDPTIAGRKLSDDDFDARQLRILYDQIVNWVLTGKCSVNN